MKLLRTLLLALVFLLVVIQLIRPERTNPPERPDQTLRAQLAPPAEVAQVLDRSCSDCHSHRTRWPWYSKVAPFSWLVIHDVQEGRDHFNMSIWSYLEPYRQRDKLEEIAEEVGEGEMPLGMYTAIHRDAKLTNDERALLVDWAKGASQHLGGSLEAPTEEEHEEGGR